MAGHQPHDPRPQDCRNRLLDEGKAYPRSGCQPCGSVLRGCPYERPVNPPTGGSSVKPPPPKQVDIALKVEGIEQARIAMEALTDAAEKAKQAIADLQGHSHGGITIKMLGEAVHIEIKPPASAL